MRKTASGCATKRVSRRARVAIVAGGCALLLACKHSSPSASEGGDAGALDPAAVLSVAHDAGALPARCKLAGGEAATLRDVGDRRSLVVGEGVVIADGFAVGVVHAPASGLEALVARVAGHQVAAEWVVAKPGEVTPDAPPPKPLAGPAGALYAAYVARSPRDGGAGGAGGVSRRIVLARAHAPGPIASFPDHADESLAFDAALSADRTRAALAWDDGASAQSATATGGITVAIAPLAAGAAPLAPRAVSAPGADVDGPRLEPRAGGGWWLAWAEHHAEATPDAGVQAGAAQRIESPAEDRAYSWIDLAVLGDDGTPVGAPRRITSPVGHAASFDLASRPNGALDVFVRDETQLREGEGGRVLHLVVRADGTDEPVATIVPDGVGRGSIDFLAAGSNASRAWLLFSDAQDRAFALPLGPDRSALGGPSAEDALEGGRLVVASGDGSDTPVATAHFFAAFPVGEGALFREINCTP